LFQITTVMAAPDVLMKVTVKSWPAVLATWIILDPWVSPMFPTWSMPVPDAGVAEPKLVRPLAIPTKPLKADLTSLKTAPAAAAGASVCVAAGAAAGGVGAVGGEGGAMGGREEDDSTTMPDLPPSYFQVMEEGR